MHIYFSGIGGTAIGPLAQIAHQAGYEVSGSDQQPSQYIDYLRKHGIKDIHIGQTAEAIAKLHDKQSIDWFVYSSALPANHPELAFCKRQGIKTSKRDELLNRVIEDKDMELITVAGTHGKTTTTAMVIWLLKKLGVPASWSVGAKLSFGDMGHYQAGSRYFVYEADEFDRNFLAFEPALSLITGVSWDHHEIFPTRDDYRAAFRDFIAQSRHSFLWQDDAEYLELPLGNDRTVLAPQDDRETIQIKGFYNRLDARLAVEAVGWLTDATPAELVKHINAFPSLSRRMEELAPNLFTDYAHTPEKIRGAMSAALELARDKGQRVVVVYEPLTNRRQHHMLDQYKDVFKGAAKVYWLPSYLAREDPDQKVLEPAELITHLSDPSIAEPAKRDANLKTAIQKHLEAGDMVVGMAGGGGNSLDDWLRAEFTS